MKNNNIEILNIEKVTDKEILELLELAKIVSHLENILKKPLNKE